MGQYTEDDSNGRLAIKKVNITFTLRTLLTAGVISLAGCASVPEDAQFTKVASQVESRSGLKADWHVGSQPHPSIRGQIKKLLTEPLTQRQLFKWPS